MPILRRLGPLAFVLFLLALTTGCTSLRYVTQASAGQYDLMTRAQDIDMLVREKHVDARTRDLLSQVGLVKAFGERHGLKATKNYTEYVRLDRSAAVWVVSASEPLRFRSKSWSFPFVGSFTYLGWFKRDEADEFADELRREGWDVDVRGAGAYSTAGYFRDAVLSTMIRPGKHVLGDLANTILHESAHSTFFARNQSTLNESIANFVGDRLAEAYLNETLGNDAEETKAYLASQKQSDERGKKLHETYETLAALYASKKTREEKLREKKEILDRVRAELRFNRPINNATLIQYKTYNSGQLELGQLLEACANDFPRFIRTLKRLESSKFEREQESDVGKVVRPLIDARCPG
jgi:predicted aminopeptidase